MMDNLVEDVRMTLQDYPELNHILLDREDGREFGDKDLKKAIEKALARINMKQPVTRYTLENFPKSHHLLLIDGGVVEALKMKGLLRNRNSMPYQDQGGVSIPSDGKSQRYMQYFQQLSMVWQQDVEEFKETISVEQAWGGVYSEYFNRYY